MFDVNIYIKDKFSLKRKINAKIELFLGKFAEVSDPTVGVDFFARLVQVKYFTKTFLFVSRKPFPDHKKNYIGHSFSPGKSLDLRVKNKVEFNN